MALSYELISQFAKLAVGDKTTSTESVVYGTVKVDSSGNKYVELDNSKQIIDLADNNQPIIEPKSSTVVTANENDRVSVLIKDHTATVTGNISSPAAQEKEVIFIKDYIQAETVRVNNLLATKAEVGALNAATADIEVLKTKKASIEDLEAANAEIESLSASIAGINTLIADKASIADLEAINADIDLLDANMASMNTLIAGKASIKDLEATNAEIEKLDANVASMNTLIAGKASIKDLEATNAEIDTIKTDNVTINETLVANKADIDNLTADKLDANLANIEYANIDEATFKNFFAESGLIQDIVTDDIKITGYLVGVTIKGDLIEGGTIVADKLVIKDDETGLYYKLNTVGEKIESEQTDYNSLNGSIITAKSITAEKMSVSDLAAFKATIGNFTIAPSIYEYFKIEEKISPTYVDIDTENVWNVGGIRTNGTFNTTNASYRHTTLLSIDEYTVDQIDILGRGESGNISSVAYYDENGTFISNQMGDVITDVIIPDNAYYMAFCIIVDSGYKNKLILKRSKIFDEVVRVSETYTTTGEEVYSYVDSDGVPKYCCMVDSEYYKVLVEETKTGAIYSGVKDSIDNTTHGLYLGSDGQIALGDTKNYLKYYKDENGNYKFSLSAENIFFGAGKDFTLDNKGMTVEGTSDNSNKNIKTVVSNNGMSVHVDNQEEATLSANDKGVVATDLHARTYLLVGNNSRFENYGKNRTGCFWIGE